MTPILTVVGATGIQGGSVINTAWDKGIYRIRAITRDVSSFKAKNLTAKGIEVISADLNDEQSLIEAFEGSTAIFAMTNFFEALPTLGIEKSMEIETAQGINLAKAAAKTSSLKHYVWSTLPPTKRKSGGKHVVPFMETKGEIDDWIKGNKELYAKTTFFWVTTYSSNFIYPMLTPSLFKPSGKYIQMLPCAPNTPMSMIGDVSKNVGVFVSAILRQPLLTTSKYVLGKVEDTTVGGLLQTWSEATGLPSQLVQLASVDVYNALFPVWGQVEGSMFAYLEELTDVVWTGDSGEDIVTKEDLGLKDDDFVGSKAVFRSINWKDL